jgi:hypothetical protein
METRPSCRRDNPFSPFSGVFPSHYPGTATVRGRGLVQMSEAEDASFIRVQDEQRTGVGCHPAGRQTDRLRSRGGGDGERGRSKVRKRIEQHACIACFNEM